MGQLDGRFLGLALAGLTSLAAETSAQTDPLGPAKANANYSSPDGTRLGGFLAAPRGEGRHPAVLMIHEWWGLNNDVTALATALADEGYVVLAADAFRGQVAQSPADASRQVGSTPAAQIAADLDAGLDFLKKQPNVDAHRIAALGFCFGGSQAMRMGTRRADLAAIVIFYGGGPIGTRAELGVMKGPVLGIYGAEDANIPRSQVDAFRSALGEQGVRSEIEIYPGVGHAFVKSTSYRNGGTAESAWKRMLAFLRSNL